MDDSVDMQALGLAIKNRREARGWSAYFLAQQAGVSDVYLRTIETGKTKRVGIGIIARLANALRISTDDLLSEAGVPITGQPLPYAAEGLVETFRHLAAPARRALIENAQTLSNLQTAYTEAWNQRVSTQRQGVPPPPPPPPVFISSAMAEEGEVHSDEELGDVGLNRPAAYDRDLVPPDDEE